jgi:hypothetical protein
VWSGVWSCGVEWWGEFVGRLRETMMLSLSCPVDVSDLSTCSLGVAK